MNKYQRCSRRILASLLILVLLIGMQTTVLALTNQFTIEDLITLYGTSGELPSWKTLQEFKRSPYELPDTDDKEEISKYKRKRELTEKVILGFQKSSKYNDFKKTYEKYCQWNSEYEEVLPKGYEDDSVSTKQYEENEKYFNKVNANFDSAMSEASMRELLDTQELANADNKITRFFQWGADAFIGTALNILMHIDRIGLTIVSGQVAVELLYISTDWLRPILGFEWGFKQRKASRGDGIITPMGTTQTAYVDDHSTTFRIVGYAARQAVEQEYKVNEDMSAAFKNDVLICYLSKKWKQLVLVAMSLLVVASGAWGSLCIMVVRIISNISNV